MKLLSFLVFIPLQILFLPLAVIGSLLISYRRMVVSKRLGVSGTASAVIEGRWMLHVFGIREDPASLKLAGALPNTSPMGMWLFLFPLWVKQKIAGSQFGYARVRESGAEPMLDFLTARTLYFDQILRRAAKDIEQFVVMGAGYDARSYGELAKRGLACFEVDQAPTQQLKIASLAKAGIDASRVTFVEVDFGQEGAFEQLRRNGYDPSRKALLLWEGVSLYLSEADVRRTLRDVRANAPAGSVLAVDFYAGRFLEVGAGAMRRFADSINEGFGFSLDFESDFRRTLEEFVSSEGFTLGETHFLGSRSAKGPFCVVAELRW